MNKYQRRFGKPPKMNGSDCLIQGSNKNGVQIEEVFTPRIPKTDVTGIKSMINRCCYTVPDQKEFGQFTDEPYNDQYQRVLQEQYGFDPVDTESDNIAFQLRALRKVLCSGGNKVENCSQYVPADSFVETADGAHWQRVDTADDIDKFLGRSDVTPNRYNITPQSIYISEVPRVKIIAETFSRFKQNNVELRKLDEKVVCVEYDVFEQSLADAEPIQIMRAFFSIRPVYTEEDKKTLTILPPTLKNKFNITYEDLQKLSEKEVEMIDGKIADNRPYLDDLRKILRRKQVDTKKNKNALDTQTLYELATMDYLNLEKDANFLSKDELQDVKDLILQKCKSSVHGINRRTVGKSETATSETKKNLSKISQSIVAELLREEGKINVFK